jgi:hypothetical protein
MNHLHTEILLHKLMVFITLLSGLIIF